MPLLWDVLSEWELLLLKSQSWSRDVISAQMCEALTQLRVSSPKTVYGPRSALGDGGVTGTWALGGCSLLSLDCTPGATPARTWALRWSFTPARLPRLIEEIGNIRQHCMETHGAGLARTACVLLCSEVQCKRDEHWKKPGQVCLPYRALWTSQVSADYSPGMSLIPPPVAYEMKGKLAKFSQQAFFSLHAAQSPTT